MQKRGAGDERFKQVVVRGAGFSHCSQPGNQGKSENRDEQADCVIGTPCARRE